jgi:hypothetical protein
VFLWGGLVACLWISTVLVALAWLAGTRLPAVPRQPVQSA